MVFQKTLSTNSDESNWNQVNDLATEVRSKDVTQIFKDDVDATRRVLLGKGADGFYGLKVSPAGVDVYTATDAQLIFNSNQNVFKIVTSGSATVTTSSYGQFQTVIPHGLTITPAVVGYVRFAGAPANSYAILPHTVFLVPSSGVPTSLSAIATATVTVDATNITCSVIQVAGGTTDGDWTFKYYILQETAN